MHTKMCILCDQQVSYSILLCAKCYNQYSDYMNENWFNELVKMQRRQEIIDNNERIEVPYNARVSLEGKHKNGVPYRRDRGKPIKDYSIIDRVLEIFDEDPSLSLRHIAKMVDNIAYNSVRNILLKYRPNMYKNR